MSPVVWVLIVFGVIASFLIASFTNVVIDRLPLALDEPNEYGELWDTRPWSEVVGGRSRCSECGAEVKATDNVPVVSYVLLRGRCRSCGEPFGAFHLVVELFIPLLVVLVTWSVVHFDGWTWALLVYLPLVPIGVAVAVIDMRTLIVPTRIVWPAAALLAVLAVIAAALAGEWTWVMGAAVGAVAMAAPLFLIWFIVPTGMGFGDVRLTVALGIAVGVAATTTGRGWPWVIVLCMFALGLAAIVGLLMGVPGLLIGRRHVPFGPALVAGALLCVALAQPILEPFG